jgi:hypothetical protein
MDLYVALKLGMHAYHLPNTVAAAVTAAVTAPSSVNQVPTVYWKFRMQSDSVLEILCACGQLVLASLCSHAT